MDRAARGKLVELAATPRWSVRTNFHLGTRTRGWLDDEAPATLARYVDYWHTHIDEHRQRPKSEWPAILEELTKRKIVSPGYRRRFREEVGGRSLVHPRPGLKICRTWPAADVDRLDQEGAFSRAVRDALRYALDVVGEPAL
jgi:hypothetical protein